MQALRRSGFEVELACGPGRGIEAVEAEGFPVHRVPISRNLFGWRNLHAVGGIRGLLRDGRFDLVHVHTPVAAVVGRAAARGAGVRVFYTMHGSAWGAGVGAGKMFTLIERRYARGTDRIFTVNPDDAKDCVRLARIPEARVQVLPAGGAGVAPEFYLTEENEGRLKAAGREELGLEAGQPVVAYVGRTTAAKGMGLLARAFRLVAEQDRAAQLVIIGGPVEGDRDAYGRERFLSEVDEPGASRVSWLGFRDEVARYMAAADVVVLLSDREGFGMSLAEASAMGKPVVATNTRGANTIVERDVTGYVVPHGDPAAVSNHTLRLLHDPKLAAKMGAAARIRARRFTREAVVDEYFVAYEAVRSEAGRSATA